MAETVARCGTCTGRLEPWQPGCCSDQCSRAVTDLPEDSDDDYNPSVFDCGGVVDAFGQVHSDADPGL